jgi:hypothetical protein
MHIEISEEKIDSRHGTSQKTGKPYSMYWQVGYMHQAGEKYPLKMNIPCEDGQAPFKVGNYDLLDSAFQVNQNGNLELRRFSMPLVARK